MLLVCDCAAAGTVFLTLRAALSTGSRSEGGHTHTATTSVLQASLRRPSTESVGMIRRPEESLARYLRPQTMHHACEMVGVGEGAPPEQRELPMQHSGFLWNVMVGRSSCAPE